MSIKTWGIFWLGRDYLVAQALSRSFAMISALIVVRGLSVSDYALFTVLLTGYTVLVSTSDLGLSGSLAFFANKFGQKNIGPYLAAVRRLRRYAFTFGAIVVSLFVLYSARNIDAGSPYILLLLGFVFVAGWFGSKIGLTSFLLRLVGKFRESYIPDLISESVKLCLVLSLFGWAQNVYAALLASLFGLLAGGVVGLSKVRNTAALSLAKDYSVHRLAIVRQVAPSLPSTVYVMVTQIMLVPTLAVTFATAASLAEIGALSRIVMVVLVAGGFVSHVVTPLLASIPDDKEYWRVGFSWLAMLAALCGMVVLLGYAFSGLVLQLLGSSYTHLGNELVLSLVGASATLVGGFIWELNRTKGVSRQQYLEVVWSGMVLIAAIYLADLTTTFGLLCVSVSSVISALLFQLVVAMPRAWRAMGRVRP